MSLAQEKRSSSSSDVPLRVFTVYDTTGCSSSSSWLILGSRLILIIRDGTDLTQTLPGPQQTSVAPIHIVLNPYTESDLVAILSA
jgi:hypothetical protein